MNDNPMQSVPPYLDTVHTGLELLGQDAEGLECVDVLEGGVSGSKSFRLFFKDGNTLILKAKGPDSPAWSREMAVREALFFRHIAGCLPVRTPRIHGIHIDEDTGVFILMESLEAAPSVPQWTEAEYQRAAGELGRLHAAFWGRTETLADLSFLRRRSLEVPPEDVEKARADWQRLGREPRFADILTPDRLRFLDRAAASVPRTQAFLAALPTTLIHGDCHVGNILHDADGNLVWTDFQGAAIGRGPEDLSFLHQRAVVAGGNIALEALVPAYHDELAAHLPEPVPAEALLRAAEASEWSTRLLQWPHYLDHASPDTLRSFMERLDVLAAHLDMPPV